MKFSGLSLLAPGVLISVVIIVVGLEMLLKNLGLIRNADLIVPCVVAAVGVLNMLGGPSSKRLFGLLIATCGVYWTLDELNIMPYSFWRVWPVFIILAGLVLLYRALQGTAAEAPSNASALNEFVMFGGVGRKINSLDFRGGSLFAMFGGHDIDLTKAGMTESTAVIDANVMFGGIEIKIPADWSASVEGIAIFGGYEDSSIQPKIEENAVVKRVIVRGFAMFGGVEVKN